MKARRMSNWSFGLALAVVPLVSGCLERTEAETTSESEVTAASVTVPKAATAPVEAEAPRNAPSLDLSSAPVRAVSNEKPLPASVKASGPVQEVIRLANSGVDERVMLAFITNSANTFNLGAEEIIYLNDLGVPGSAVTAMIQRDQVLKSLPSSEATAVAMAEASEPVAAPSAAPAQSTPMVATGPGMTAATQPEAASATFSSSPTENVDSTFHDALAPYGNWIDVEGYGLCWQPTVSLQDSSWQPYFTGGHWVYTDSGWYWLSDYSWGWAPFHYGRWFRNRTAGWCWAPDSTWGPSWVSWGYTDDYCGWAPLPPGPLPRAGFGPPLDCFAFVPFRHFRDHHLDHFAMPHHQMKPLFDRMTWANNIAIAHNMGSNPGIPVDRVVAATHTPVTPLTIHDGRPTPGQTGRGDRLDPRNHTLTVVRPPLPQTGTLTPNLPGHSPTGPRLAGGTPTSPMTSPPTRPTHTSPVAQSKPTLQTPTPTPRTGTPTVRDANTGPQPAGRGTPLRVQGPTSPGSPTTVTGSPRETYPPGSLIVTGRRDTPSQNLRPAPAGNPQSRMLLAETDQRPLTYRPNQGAPLYPNAVPNNPTRQNLSPRSTVEPPSAGNSPPWATPRPNNTPTRQMPAPRREDYSYNPGNNSSPAPQAPMPTMRQYNAPSYQPPVRTESPRYQAPAYQAPASHIQSPAYTPPAAPAPRPQVSESRPAPVAPSSPVSSGSASHSGRSDRNGR